jgi:hypothetical protein
VAFKFLALLLSISWHCARSIWVEMWMERSLLYDEQNKVWVLHNSMDFQFFKIFFLSFFHSLFTRLLHQGILQFVRFCTITIFSFRLYPLIKKKTKQALQIVRHVVAESYATFYIRKTE